MNSDTDAPGTFTEDEMRDYNPQPCQTCGQPTMQYGFEDTRDSHGLPHPIFTLTEAICTNQSCASHGSPEGSSGTQGSDPSEPDGAVV